MGAVRPVRELPDDESIDDDLDASRIDTPDEPDEAVASHEAPPAKDASHIEDPNTIDEGGVASTEAPATTDVYRNDNPRATESEIRIGQLLNEHLPETVWGTPEGGPSERSADYRFESADGTIKSADLYQPQSGRIPNICDHIFRKTDQAEIIAVEFGAGHTADMGGKEADEIGAYVKDTPGHSIERLIFIKDNEIIRDLRC